jgi:hypothetical protein
MVLSFGYWRAAISRHAQKDDELSGGGEGRGLPNKLERQNAFADVGKFMRAVFGGVAAPEFTRVDTDAMNGNYDATVR